MKPPLRRFSCSGFHRLIPSRYSEWGTVLADITDGIKMLEDIVMLDGATNDRVQGEQQGLSGISTYELVYGIPNSHIVNAAFTHTSDAGSRFNDHARGGWYAAGELETSIAEVAFHKARRLREIVVPDLPENRPDRETSTFDDWLADFEAAFHVLAPAKNFAKYLEAGPIPQCYAASQQLARELIGDQSNGLVYPSVRRKGARCLVCFRPALVYNPRLGERIELEFVATKTGYKHQVRR